jgi:hypothetical protein
MRLSHAIRTDPVGTPALAQELARVGIKPLAQCLEGIRSHFTVDSEHLCTPPLPPADDTLAFGVIIAMLEVTG